MNNQSLNSCHNMDWNSRQHIWEQFYSVRVRSYALCITYDKASVSVDACGVCFMVHTVHSDALHVACYGLRIGADSSHIIRVHLNAHHVVFDRLHVCRNCHRVHINDCPISHGGISVWAYSHHLRRDRFRVHNNTLHKT